MDGDAALGGRTVSLDGESAERLARLCAELGCSPEQLIRDALLTLEELREEENTPEHLWSEADDAAMRQAIAEFEAGEGIPHEQVMAEARATISG